MLFSRLITACITLLALAFVAAFSAWGAVALHRADLFLPLTWAAAALATPATAALALFATRFAIMRYGAISTALATLATVVAMALFGAVPILEAIGAGLLVALPLRSYGLASRPTR